MSILCDIHEPQWIVQKLRQLSIPVESRKLDVGDYIVKDVAIERKQLNDLLNSIIDGRIWNQLYTLSNYCNSNSLVPICVLTGRIPSVLKFRELDYRQVLKTVRVFQITSYFSYRVPVFHLDSDEELVDFLLEILKRRTRTVSLKPVPKKSASIEEVKSDMLCAIPTVGRQTANYLAKHFSITQLGLMDELQLSNITVEGRKLGKKALRIKEALTK